MTHPSDVAAMRAAIVPPALPEGKLTEAEALEILQAWLLGPDHGDNRLAFGNYVRLWIRRWGLKVVNTTATDSDSLYNQFLLRGLIGDTPNSTHHVLGTGRKILVRFWENNEALKATLGFCRFSASSALIDLANYPAEAFVELPQEVHPETLLLLDSFWLTPTLKGRRPNVCCENVRRFGQFLKAGILRPWGNSTELSYRMARKMGWSTNLSSNKKVPTSATRLSQILSGNPGHSWNLQTLTVLAKFGGVTVEQLVKDYNAWLEKQPRDAKT